MGSDEERRRHFEPERSLVVALNYPDVAFREKTSVPSLDIGLIDRLHPVGNSA